MNAVKEKGVKRGNKRRKEKEERKKQLEINIKAKID
jgi:hypothetical protein